MQEGGRDGRDGGERRVTALQKRLVYLQPSKDNPLGQAPRALGGVGGPTREPGKPAFYLLDVELNRFAAVSLTDGQYPPTLPVFGRLCSL